jgi:predicted metal-dependent phosphoesterase TrpH
MKFRLDLHVHSANSGDNDADPEATIVQAIGRGLHGIVFTEHYSYAASEPVELLKEKYAKRILIMRGVEFSAEEGHCLVFGVNTDQLAMKYAPIKEVIVKVSEAGGIAVPSHPYRSINSIGDRVLKLDIFALEGYNGCNMHIFNEKAIDAARRMNIPFTGGSDAHASGEVGSCYTEFTDLVTPDNLVELLKAGRYHGVDTRKISGRMSKFF